jgi:uncharacterized protein YerC
MVSFLLSLRGNTGRLFLEQFMTETEQIMFAKRLATLLMLMEKCSYYRIAKTLGVSVSTSRRIHEKLLKGDFRTIEQIVQNKKSREHFFKQLEKFSRGGLPPIAGDWRKNR